ncbi:MAG: hypothetical protein RJA99_4242 [Pseudomonadota bacterium]|jgi:hypothetical protein
MSNASAIGRLLFTAAAAAIGGPAGAAIAIGGNLAIGAYDARKVRRQIEQNRQQRDLTLTLPTSPRRRVYGRDRVPGVLRYWTTHGPENRLLSLVYVFADHPCDAIEEIHFDDRSLGTLDGSGYVQSGSPWWKSLREPQTEQFAPVGLTFLLSGLSVTTPAIGIGETVLVHGTDYTTSVSAGKTLITLTSDVSALGPYLVVDYVVDIGRPLARVRTYLGAVPQTADATLISDSGGEWTSACRLDGQTYAIVTLEWDETTAANGIPTVYALMRGARVFDPRTSTTAWSDNWALCIRDYLKSASSCTDSEIDDTAIIASANIADQLVTVDTGSLKRYTINGPVESTTDPVEVLQDMALAGGGTITWSAGKFVVLAGAYRTPVSITLSDADLAGGYQYQGEISREDRFNTVLGIFRDARAVGGVALYTRTDYTPYESSAYIAEDNGERIERRIDLPYVTDYRAANRIAKQIMRRARQGARITAAWKLKALPLQVGNVVTVTLARMGLSAKPFEVVSWRHQFPGSVELVLQETDATCYDDWSYTEVAFLDPAPNTLLPSPTDVASPVLAVTCTATAPATIKVLGDGSQIPYARISWPARSSAGEYVEIRWKRHTETGYRTLTARPGETAIDIEGISGGDVLQIVGVAVNGIGARSAPWIVQQYRVDAALPAYTGQAPALSANLLTNTTWELNTAGWTTFEVNVPASAVAFARRPAEAPFGIAGSPSSATIMVYDASVGNGKGGGVVSRHVSGEPGSRVVGYVGLVPYGIDAFVSLAFYDGSGARVATVNGNVVPGTLGAFAAMFADPAAYSVSGVIATWPAGATTCQLGIVAAGNMLGVPIKAVAASKPFLGTLPDGTTDYPPWAPGGSNVVGTQLIANDAVTAVYRSAFPVAQTINWIGPNGYQFGDQLPTVTIPASADIPQGAVLRVQINGGVVVRRLVSVVEPLTLRDLSAIWTLTDSRDGSVAYAGTLFDLHYASEPPLVNVDLQGAASFAIEYAHVAGVARTFTLGLQLYSAANGVLLPVASQWQITRLANTAVTVDALKTVLR